MKINENKNLFLTIATIMVAAFLSLFPLFLSFASILILPGLLLVAASTAVIYSLPTAAIYFGVKGPIIRYGLAGIGVMMSLTIAYVPSLTARQQVEEFTQEVLTPSLSEPPVSQPTAIELAGVLASRNYRSGKPICDTLCQKLLFNGKVDSIWIRDRNGGQARRFTVERRGKCPELTNRLVSRFQSRVAHGECLIEETTSSPKPDVVIRVENGPRTDIAHARKICRPRNRLRLWLVQGPIQTLDVYERIAGQLVLKEHGTKLSVLVPPTPFRIKSLRCGGSFPKLTTHFATKEVVLSDFSVEEVLKRRYSISLEADENSLPPKQRERMNEERYRLVLTRVYGSDEIISRSETRLIDEFISGIFRKEELKPDDIELLRLAITQHSLRDAPSFRYNRHMESLAPLMSDMVTRLELPVNASRNGDRQSIRQSLSGLLSLMDQAELKRFSARLQQVLNDPDKAQYALSIIEMWGDISDDPSPVLLNLAQDKSRRVKIRALTGLCDVVTAQEPDLITYLIGELDRSSSDYFVVRPVMAALMRVGRRSEIMNIIQRSQTQKKNQLTMFLDRIESYPSLKKCRV